MRFRRRRDAHVEPVTARALVEGLRRDEAAGTITDSGRAQLAGLTEEPTRRARLVPLEGETTVQHGLYLIGKLVVFLELLGTPVEPGFLVPRAATYCAGVAERAAKPGLDLQDPRLPLHTYAMVRVEKKIGGPLPVDQESLLLTWLVNQLGLRPRQNAGRLLAERRKRRHAKLFPGPVSDDVEGEPAP